MRLSSACARYDQLAMDGEVDATCANALNKEARLDVCRPGGTFLPPIPERNAGAAPG